MVVCWCFFRYEAPQNAAVVPWWPAMPQRTNKTAAREQRAQRDFTSTPPLRLSTPHGCDEHGASATVAAEPSSSFPFTPVLLLLNRDRVGARRRARHAPPPRTRRLSAVVRRVDQPQRAAVGAPLGTPPPPPAASSAAGAPGSTRRPATSAVYFSASCGRHRARRLPPAADVAIVPVATSPTADAPLEFHAASHAPSSPCIPAGGSPSNGAPAATTSTRAASRFSDSDKALGQSAAPRWFLSVSQIVLLHSGAPRALASAL